MTGAIKPVLDKRSIAGLAELQLITEKPKYGQKIEDLTPVEDLKRHGYTEFHLLWDGKGVIPVVARNSTNQTGHYMVLFFWLDETAHQLGYQGSLEVRLEELNDRTLPLHWEKAMAANFGNRLTLRIKQEGRDSGVATLNLNPENLPSKVVFPALPINNSQVKRATFWFE